MAKTTKIESLWPAKTFESGFSVFGFGYNGFSQILTEGNASNDVVTLQSLCSSESAVPCVVTVQGNITGLVASWSTTFYLKENGQVCAVGWIPGTKCIGSQENLFTEKNVTDISCSWTQLVFLTKDRTCFIWKDYTKPNSLPLKVKSNVKFKDMGCSESSCILVTGSGQVGYAMQRETTVGSSCQHSFVFKPVDLSYQITSVACGKEHAILLSESGVVFSLGGGSRGQLGCGLTVEEQSPSVIQALEGIKIHYIAAGGWHSAAISECGDLYMWGWNESGQLGLALNHCDTNDTSSSSTQIQCQAFPVLVDIPDDVDVMTVSCGTRHTAAVTGYYGQLGHDDREHRLRPTPVLALSALKHKPKTVSCGDWSTFVIIAN